MYSLRDDEPAYISLPTDLAPNPDFLQAGERENNGGIWQPRPSTTRPKNAEQCGSENRALQVGSGVDQALWFHHLGCRLLLLG